jgi:class 3 adenylate cyclase
LTVYFLMELWIRITLRKVFPVNALLSIPPSVRVGVLPKMLAVSLLIGVFPVSLISHITLSQIRKIHAGSQSIEIFIDQMPELIGFLLSLSVLGAVVLSVLLAKSISEPLRVAGSSMDEIQTGAKNVMVPVVSNDEIGVMGEGFNRMMEGLRERDSIRETFGRYLSKEVVNEILKSPGGIDLQGEQREITILVSDLRGFTKMTDCNDPHVVLRTLNRYLERMTDIIIDHSGTIDEFTGDGILVFFGAPRPVPDHQIQSVQCALEMQAAMQSLNEENSTLGLPQLEMGIAINTGELIVGNIGSEKRKKYGAIGSPINVAYRTESHAAAKHILITPTVYERVADRLRIGEKREVTLKGIEEPVTLYQVAGISSSPVPDFK